MKGVFVANAAELPEPFADPQPLGKTLEHGPVFIPHPVETVCDIQVLPSAKDSPRKVADKTYLMVHVSPNGDRVEYPCKMASAENGSITFESTTGPVNAETIVVQEKPGVK